MPEETPVVEATIAAEPTPEKKKRFGIKTGAALGATSVIAAVVLYKKLTSEKGVKSLQDLVPTPSSSE